MRFRLSIIIVLIIVCVCLQTIIVRGVRKLHGINLTMSTPRIGESVLQRCYPLWKDDNTVVFDLPADSRSICISTNATFLKPLPDEPIDRLRSGWRYAVEYSLLGVDDELLSKERYHFRSTVFQYEKSEAARSDTEPVLSRAFFADTNRLAANTARINLSSNRLKNAKKIRLRLVEADEAIDDVCLRVQSEGVRLGYDEPNLWEQLSAKRRENLSAASIYPEDLLRSDQKLNLLRYRRSSLVPVGVEGRDYKARNLFVDLDADLRRIDDEIAPTGLVGPNRVLSFQLPDDAAGLLKLKFESVERTDVPANVTLQVVGGRKLVEPRRWEVAADSPFNESSSFEVRVDGGLVHLESDQSLVTSFQLTPDSGDTIEVQPSHQLTRMFWIPKDDHLAFRVKRLDDETTTYRISLRKIGCESIPATTVACHLVDSFGETFDTLVFEADFEQSRYDYISDEPDLSVSDKVYRYITLPSKVSAIRFDASIQTRNRGRSCTGIFVGVASRISEMAPVRGVTDEELTTRDWFPIRPVGFDQAIKYHLDAVVQLQPRLPQVREFIATGAYKRESFQPMGDSRGRFIFVPKAAQQLEPKSSPHEYVQLPGDYSLDKADVVSKLALPKAYYFATDDNRPEIRVLRNEKTWGIVKNTRRSGQILLNELPSSESFRLRVDGPRQWHIFLQGLEIDSSRPRYLRRLATIWNSQKRVFDFQREGREREYLTLEYFCPVSDDLSADEEICISIQQLGDKRPSGEQQPKVFQDFILPQRRFVIRHSNVDRDEVCYVSGTTDHTEVYRYRCVLPLGDNLIPGAYRVSVTRESNSPSYLTLSRSVPASPSKRTFYRRRETNQ